MVLFLVRTNYLTPTSPNLYGVRLFPRTALACLIFQKVNGSYGLAGI